MTTDLKQKSIQTNKIQKKPKQTNKKIQNPVSSFGIVFRIFASNILFF